MSNPEKPEPIKDTEPLNAIETDGPFADLDFDSISSLVATSGSDDSQDNNSKAKTDSPIGNCRACGFPRNRDFNATKAMSPDIGNCPECHNALTISDNGYFVVSRDKKDHFDIAYQWISAERADIPVAKENLLKEIITTNTIIKTLYFTADTDFDAADQKKNTAIKEKYFEKLLSLAQAGLTGTKARPELAALALERLKVEIITVEGQRIKNTYMKELGRRAFLSSLISLILFFITSTAIFPDQATLADLLIKNPDSVVLFQSDFLAAINMCSVIWFGAMVGTWVSFAARNKAIDFEQLSILETDRLEPTIRLIYIGICAIIFSLFLSSGIVALEVGGLSTANIANSISTQLVLGLLCGLTESKIGIYIHEKTAAMLKNQKEEPQSDQNQPAK